MPSSLSCYLWLGMEFSYEVVWMCVQVQEIQEVRCGRVVLKAITIVHRRPGQNLVRICVDISNPEACYLLGNYPIVFLGSQEAGATLVMTAIVGDTAGRQCTPWVSFNSSALVPPRTITIDDIFPSFFFLTVVDCLLLDAWIFKCRLLVKKQSWSAK
ncbi:hypothetical protein ACQJBY_008800 [Aegilops geniculata]